ncbi:MAG: tRNA (adenosine(37)-N6)-threonylcarbamoyltransferase complex transferase subunit TsaD [Tepidisphaeraceae bacterium]
MLLLGIESTCDETGVALVRDGRVVVSDVVASQAEIHAVYRGVVPEIASRAHIENILPVLHEALDKAGAKLADLDAVAVAHRPGLIGCLLVGVTAAKTLAWSAGKPLVGVDHVQAHLYSVMLDSSSEPEFPAVGLVCSGGHTAIYLARSWTDVTLLGKTIDDAVGEAYDKVAATLGLGYPGGPIIDKLAQDGNPSAIRFPRSLLTRDSLDFSFSGLKTSVLYHVHGDGRGKLADGPRREIGDTELHDIAASFQAACVDTLIIKLTRAIEQTGARSVIIGGGVSANRGLRTALPRLPVPSYSPPLRYCTDNAAMIAGLGTVLLRSGATTGLELDAIASTAIK